jgi:hypothetical protein
MPCCVHLDSDQVSTIHLHGRQEMIGADQIMRLTTGQVEADRVGQGVDVGQRAVIQPTRRKHITRHHASGYANSMGCGLSTAGG